MRNYVSTQFLQYNLHAEPVGLDLLTTSAGSTEEELRENVAINAAFVEQTNDPTGIYTWTIQYPNPVVTIYWQLDRRNISRFANYLADFLYLGAVVVGNIPQMSIVKPKLTVDYTPRHGWEDVDGVRHREPASDKGKRPDFRGAAGLIEALQGFLKLASDLTAMKEARKAEIVLYAYNQVIKQVWSITQAIQYLIDNRITATV